MTTTVRDEINRLRKSGTLWREMYCPSYDKHDPNSQKIVLVQVLGRELQMLIRDYLVNVHRSWVFHRDLSCIPMNVDTVEIHPSGSILFMPKDSCWHRGMSYAQLFTNFLEDVMRVVIVPQEALEEYQHLLSKLRVCSTEDQLISFWYHSFFLSVGERASFPNDIAVGLDLCQDLVFRNWWSYEYVQWAKNSPKYGSQTYDMKTVASKFVYTKNIYAKSDYPGANGNTLNHIPNNHYGEWRLARNIIVHPRYEIKKILYLCEVLLSLFGFQLNIKIFDFLWDMGIWIDFKALSTSEGVGVLENSSYWS